MVQLTKTGFQTLVNNQPAPGVAGDFYGANPRAVVLAGPSALVAPAGGLIVGNFAWADLTTELVSQSYNPNGQLGFLRRSDQAIITDYLGISTFVLNAGFPVTLFSQGDFWGFFAAGATPGQNVYADPSNGALVAGASAPAVASATASAGASFTGVVTANVLTASAVTGYLTPGDLVSGTGVVNVALGAQLTGTPGGAGTYTFVHADVISEALTSTSTVLDVTAVGSGTLAAGDDLNGSGVTAGTQIVSQNSGTPGGAGFYTLSVGQRFASTTVTVNAIATPWKVKSTAAAGKVAKISTWGK
jgi:hypothetical protein